MCYTQRKIEGGVGALRESDDANFLKPNGQSRNLHVYGARAAWLPTNGSHFLEALRYALTNTQYTAL